MFKDGFRERIRGGVKMDNKMPKLAKEFFNKELEEEFEVDIINHKIYKFTERGLEFKYNDSSNSWRPANTTLGRLLRGNLKIKWKPKSGEKYYFVFSQYPKPQRLLYYNESMADRLIFKRGLIFRTEQEAIQDMKDRGWWEE